MAETVFRKRTNEEARSMRKAFVPQGSKADCTGGSLKDPMQSRSFTVDAERSVPEAPGKTGVPGR